MVGAKLIFSGMLQKPHPLYYGINKKLTENVPSVSFHSLIMQLKLVPPPRYMFSEAQYHGFYDSVLPRAL
jgi:hypothetical protein